MESINKKLDQQLKQLESEKYQLEHAAKLHKAISDMYLQLEEISRQKALPVEVLLTGVKNENAIAADYR